MVTPAHLAITKMNPPIGKPVFLSSGFGAALSLVRVCSTLSLWAMQQVISVNRCSRVSEWNFKRCSTAGEVCCAFFFGARRATDCEKRRKRHNYPFPHLKVETHICHKATEAVKNRVFFLLFCSLLVVSAVQLFCSKK